MLENIPKEIKKIYKILIILAIVILLIGIIFNQVELYFAYFVGSLISTINILLLINGVQKIFYLKSRPKLRGNLEFLKRLIILGIGFFLVGYVSKKYFSDYLIQNLVFTGLGALNFKFSIFINQMILMFAKKR